MNNAASRAQRETEMIRMISFAAAFTLFALAAAAALMQAAQIVA